MSEWEEMLRRLAVERFGSPGWFEDPDARDARQEGEEVKARRLADLERALRNLPDD